MDPNQDARPTFCTDTDLLRWEPMLPIEAAFASQTLLSADATLAGTTLTLAGGSLVAARVRAGDVVALDGAGVDGCYPIVSVEGATSCTVSVLQSGLTDAPPAAVAPKAGAGLRAIVRTFWPQRQLVSDLLARMSGVEPGTAARVANAEILRRPCALGTLQLIYHAMAASAEPGNADLIVRAELYERLYRKSLRGLVVELDQDGDGVVDARRVVRLVQFVRV